MPPKVERMFRRRLLLTSQMKQIMSFANDCTPEISYDAKCTQG